MRWIALNLILGVVDVALLVALARGARARVALTLALSVMALVLCVETGFPEVSFHTMRSASYVLFAHAPIVLLGSAWLLRENRRRAAGCSLLAAALLLVAADAFLREPHALVTSTYAVKLGATARIVVMSDYQATSIGPYEERVLREIGELHPDLVLLAGDYIQVYGSERAGVVQEFRRAWRSANIHPKLGAFAVRGDVEPDGWESEIFDGLGVVTSDTTRTVRAGDFTITLLSLGDSEDRALQLPRTSENPGIVLGHHPDFALGDGPAGLLVAGHTHGGQVQIPFFGPPFILSAVPRAWGGGGLHRVDATRELLVTRGAGVEHADDAPLLRFFCRPEIGEVEIVP